MDIIRTYQIDLDIKKVVIEIYREVGVI